MKAAYAMLLRRNGVLELHTPSKNPACAELTVSGLEGAAVVGLVTLYPEEQTGTAFWRERWLARPRTDNATAEG